MLFHESSHLLSGDSLVGFDYGDVPLFKGALSLKSAELWVSCEEICRIMGSAFDKYCKITRKET